MENKLFFGSIVRVLNVAQNNNIVTKTVKNIILYKDDNQTYYGLDDEITYSVLNEESIVKGAIVVDPTSLFPVTDEDFKKSYNYQIAKHIENIPKNGRKTGKLKYLGNLLKK